MPERISVGIDIRVYVPEITPEQRREFAEGVMAVFRAMFPDATPIYKEGYPPAVTVHWSEDEADIKEIGKHYDETE